MGGETEVAVRTAGGESGRGEVAVDDVDGGETDGDKTASSTDGVRVT